MDVLYGEKTSVFHGLVDDFAPESVRPVADAISSRLPSSELAQQLVQDFSRLDEISRVLRSRYNDCSILFTLPPECVAVILHFVAAVEPPRWNVPDVKDIEFGSLLPNTLGFIRLGHICRRLRTILLNTRALWAAFAFALSPKAVEQMLARAGTAPLFIKLESQGKPSPELLNSVRDHIHNAFVISFAAPALLPRARAWPFEVQNIHKETFPFLEGLKLHSSLNLVHSDNVYQLPPIDAPRLRHVSMENIFVPCTLSSLDTFKLNFSYDFADELNLPSTPVFFKMLRSLSNVRVLTLDNCTPDLPPKGNEDAFTFPHLREICLGGTLTTCRTFWQYLQLPPDAKVKLKVELDTPSLDIQFAFLDTISGHFKSPDCPRITALSVDDDQTGDRLRVVMAVPERGSVQETWTGPLASDYGFLLDITLSGWSPDALDHIEGQDLHDQPFPAPFLNLLQRIHGAYDLKNLKMVEVASAIGYSATRWKETLSKYDSVTTLAIDPFPPHQGLWAALCPRSPADGESPIFPRLENIAIQTTIEFDHPIVGLEEDEHDMPAPWSDFCPGLQRRAAAGAGIQRLTFANFTAENVEGAGQLLQDLRAVVPEVVGAVTHVEDRRPGILGLF
ncbi:hypothetical protein PENSPDRAFT_666948 [Peniophora sp. CONT]|nr:hypothetical protein PENSPDRAFT_666948 [Peniophora sp. CONT]